MISTEKEFIGSLEIIKINLRKADIFFKKSRSLDKTLEQQVDDNIVRYCVNILNLDTKLIQNSVYISANIARSFLETEVIVKWLKADSENYNFFCATAEFANIDLLKSMKEFKKIDNPGDAATLLSFDEAINSFESKLKVGNFTKYEANSKDLNSLKKIAKKLNCGERYKAYFDFFSKMSHPTAWIINIDPDSAELVEILKMSNLQIAASLDTIIKTICDSGR